MKQDSAGALEQREVNPYAQRTRYYGGERSYAARGDGFASGLNKRKHFVCSKVNTCRLPSLNYPGETQNNFRTAAKPPFSHSEESEH